MIVSRYLVKEVMTTLIAILVIVLVIVLANQVVRLLGQLAAGKISTGIFIRLILLHIPYFITYLLPLSLFLAILIGYGRLYAENEMVAFFSNGLSYAKFYLIGLSQIVLIMALVTVTSIWLTPAAKNARNQLKLSSDHFSSLFNRLQPGQLQEIPNNRGVIYVKDINSKQASDVFIATMNPDTPRNSDTLDIWNILIAKTGNTQSTKKFGPTNNHYYMLNDGHMFHAQDNPNNQHYLAFDGYGLHLYQETSEHLSTSTMTTRALMAIRATNREANAELQWRISQPLSAFVLGVLALALCKINPRKGQFSYIVPAILIYIIYMNVLLTLRAWVEHGDITSLYWFHPAVLLIIILAHILKQRTPHFFNRSKGG